jgi:hypothetical protein
MFATKKSTLSWSHRTCHHFHRCPLTYLDSSTLHHIFYASETKKTDAWVYNFHTRAFFLSMYKSQENKTFKTTPLWPQAFFSSTKLGKLMISFSTSYFPLIQLQFQGLCNNTHIKTKQLAKLSQKLRSLITCAFTITTSTNHIPLK